MEVIAPELKCRFSSSSKCDVINGAFRLQYLCEIDEKFKGFNHTTVATQFYYHNKSTTMKISRLLLLGHAAFASAHGYVKSIALDNTMYSLLNIFYYLFTNTSIVIPASTRMICSRYHNIQ